MTNIPRSEYPRPQMRRPKWQNLNGEWDYVTDKGKSGRDRRLFIGEGFTEKIIVPFCRESELSGIGDKDFCAAVWYKKEIEIPADWQGNRVLLHIGACDFYTEVWVNGVSVGNHTGGYVSFSFDITDALKEGVNTLVICADDDTRSGLQASGKQHFLYTSEGCFYTRTTGIWQTVWLECVPQKYISNLRIVPNLKNKSVHMEIEMQNAEGDMVTAATYFEGQDMGQGIAYVENGKACMDISLKEAHPWELGKGGLYDLKIRTADDYVESYFGLRSVGVKDGFLVLNGKVVYQRLVLDQGFYPDGIYTAPTEEALIADITRSMDIGFNGARLHQKVFEPLFLYHCDRLGYMVWGEHANWGLDLAGPGAWKTFLPEWLEILKRDFNHPAIIGWCPLNETQFSQDPDLVKMLHDMTKAIDPTRLYIGASGWTHVKKATDMYDLHHYEQDPEKFKAILAPLEKSEPINIHHVFPKEHAFMACPTFVSEYGGTRWTDEIGWGYGEAPKDYEDCLNRIEGLTRVLLEHPKMGGFCYTQLTDVEQECNGLYTYDRKLKFEKERLRRIFGGKAKIEEE